MISKEIIVRCESGLHNNQATFFVQKAKNDTNGKFLVKNVLTELRPINIIGSVRNVGFLVNIVFYGHLAQMTYDQKMR